MNLMYKWIKKYKKWWLRVVFFNVNVKKQKHEIKLNLKYFVFYNKTTDWEEKVVLIL